MAFKEVGQDYDRALSSANDIEVGKHIEGHVTKIGSYQAGLNKDGSPDMRYFLMMTIGGERVKVYASGKLKYKIVDGEIKAGLLTRIERLPDSKSGRSEYRILQDDTNTVPVEATDYSKFERPAKSTTTSGGTDNSIAAKAKRLEQAVG